MAEKTTIARPYALAMFDIARSKGNLAQTGEALQIAAIAAGDATINSMIGNPDVADDKLVGLLADLCGDKASAEVKNFFSLLAENDRLTVLPEISALYDEYKSDEERTVEAEVTSASELSAEQKDSITKALKARMGCDVTLVCKTDESLVGGAVIRAGDLVIDGSITSQLQKLAFALSR